MSCSKYQEYIIPYAEGTLSTMIMEEMAAHLFACPECRRELDEIIDTIGILKETEYPQMEPAVNLRSRVMAQIADETPVRKPWWRTSLPALSAAVGLVFICISMIIYSRGGPGTRKDAHMEDAIRSAVVSTRPSSSPNQEKLSESLIATEKTASDSTTRSNRTITGSTASMERGKSDAAGGKQPGTKTIDKPVMMAKVEKRNIYDDIEKDRIYIPEKSDSFEGEPLLSKPLDTVKGTAKQRPVDDRQMLNAMVPGGAQNQQQSLAPGMPGAQTEMNDNSAKSAFDSANDVRNVDETGKRIANDILTQERKLAAFPNSITVMKKLLEGYRASGRAEDEYAIAVKLTQVDPNNAEYWFARGQAAERMKMPRTAVTCYRTAIKKNLSGANLELAKSRLQALEK